MSRNYIRKNILSLLMAGFSLEDLKDIAFVIPELQSIYNNLPEYIGKQEIARRIIDGAEQRNCTHKILAEAEERNLSRYKEYLPYWSEAAQLSVREAPLSLVNVPTTLTRETGQAAHSAEIFVNIKTRHAIHLREMVRNRPNASAPAITGFWRVNLDRVLQMTQLRMILIPSGEAVFEAEIDHANCHIACEERMNEYLELQAHKREKPEALRTHEQTVAAIHGSIREKRVVIGFKNIREPTGNYSWGGKNPIAYLYRKASSMTQ